MEVLQCDVAQACLVPDARLFRGEDAGYLVSTASECGDREEMSPGGRNLNKQAARGKPWRKLEAAYGDGDGARLASAKSNALPSKSPPKRPEKGKSRKKVVAARRKYHRRPPKQRWSSGGWATEEDGDSQCFPHRRPNASKFSKVGPNSCVFLPVPEDIFIEDMLSDVPHYCSNSQLKSGEFWCSVAADIPPYRSAGRTRRQKDTFKEKIQGTLK